MAELPREAHVRGEIETADQQHIDAIYGRDSVGIADTLPVLDHDAGQNLVVDGGLRFSNMGRQIAKDWRRTAPASCAHWRVMEGVGNALRLLRRVNMRHDNPECAVVE